jgi:glycosyltransferase involved in cell wall biosynthesis
MIGGAVIITPAMKKKAEEENKKKSNIKRTINRSIDKEKEMDEISVIIPVSSAGYVKQLRACVNSVKKQDYPQGKIEVIVVCLQKGSIGNVDGLRLFCKEQDTLLVTHVHNKEAWPPALSRNVGYKKAGGRILVSLDADGVLDTRTFRVAYQHMRAKRCAVRVRTSLVPYGPGEPIFFNLGAKEFQRTVSLGKKAPGPGCCIMAKREAVWAIHGWDEEYVGYGPADWDFVERLEKAGWPVVNISKTNNIWTLHQEHERVLGTPLHYKNIEYHDISLKKPSPVRNTSIWGGDED